MESDNDILGLVSNHDEKASLLLLQAISNECANALVSAGGSAISRHYDVGKFCCSMTYTCLRCILPTLCHSQWSVVKNCARIAGFRQFIAGPLAYKIPSRQKIQKFGGGAGFCRAVGAISCTSAKLDRAAHRDVDREGLLADSWVYHFILNEQLKTIGNKPF